MDNSTLVLPIVQNVGYNVKLNTKYLNLKVSLCGNRITNRRGYSQAMYLDLKKKNVNYILHGRQA